MSLVSQIPRFGTLWILCAFSVSVVPLLFYLPVWLWLVAGMAAVWRGLIFRGLLGLPGRWLTFSLLAIGLGGIVLSFGRLYGLEPMVSLLVIAYALKLLEMDSRRDARLTVYLGYFTAATLCIFDQQLTTGLLVFAAYLVITASLAGINQTDLHRQYFRPLKLAGLMTVQAIPLLVVLFLVMPRLGPLWSVPTLGGSAVTGMGDTLRLGAVTDLARSGKTAFRVQFDGPLPARESLYWRGLTLSQYDGQEWTRSSFWSYRRGSVYWPGQPAPGWAEPLVASAPLSEYQVIIEPTGQSWLYALGTSRPLSAGTGLSPDLILFSPRPVNRRMGYRAALIAEDLQLEQSMSPLERRVETAVPDGFNPKTARQVRSWQEEGLGPEAISERLLALFNEAFVYTLEPAPLGRDAVDDFLWQTRQGFCEHFAASYVYAMRLAGVPARVVLGYMGGEYHDEGQYLILRQYDAHAWAEVWFPDTGWVRVDPTAAVAPERIYMSPMELFADDSGFLDDSPLLRFRGIDWLNRLRLELEELEYAWGRWVLGYDNEQTAVLARLLGEVKPERLALFLLAGGLLSFAPFGFRYLFTRTTPSRDPLDEQFVRFQRIMARRGVDRSPGESVTDYADRCVAHQPHDAAQIQAICRTYERARYGGDRVASSALAPLVRSLARRRGRGGR